MVDGFGIRETEKRKRRCLQNDIDALKILADEYAEKSEKNLANLCG